MKQACVMLVLNKDGLILAVSRRNDPTKFGFPGGKLEFQEQLYLAAVRETQEETNVKVGGCTPIYDALEPKESEDGEDFHTTCFYAIVWKGTPQDSEEGKVRWMTSAQLTSPELGAFPAYNAKALENFKIRFPDIKVA